MENVHIAMILHKHCHILIDHIFVKYNRRICDRHKEESLTYQIKKELSHVHVVACIHTISKLGMNYLKETHFNLIIINVVSLLGNLLYTHLGVSP